MRSRWASMVVALVMWLGISGAGQSAEAISEAEITSAILFNFARYTRWPEQDNATGEGQVAFCFFDTAGLADVFEGMVGGATLKGRRVTVIRVTAAAELAGCQLVYTDDPLPAWLGRPDYRLLTIGRGDQFVTNGGVIALIQEDNHLRFKINRRVARDTGLVLSSRLLRLAEELIDE